MRTGADLEMRVWLRQIEIAEERIGHVRVVVLSGVDDELQSTDCVIIVTDHSEIDYKRVCSLAPLIVDTRNALNGEVRSSSKARVIRL